MNKCLEFILFLLIIITIYIYIIDKEVENPKHNIPLGIMLAISICTTCFLGLSAVLSLIMPYYLINVATPFPIAFTYVNLSWAKYFISFGIIMSISAR